MSAICEPTESLGDASVVERLNEGCFCTTLDRGALQRALEGAVGDVELCAAILSVRPHLFSPAPVFLAAAEVACLRRIVEVIERVIRMPGYRKAVGERASPAAQPDFGPHGVLMGYDFHLSAGGPRLIEINTNAGGAFLNAMLAEAQRECCIDAGVGFSPGEAARFPEAAREMFAAEWRRQRGRGVPGRIAIVDDAPRDQFLYPEFLIAQRMLRTDATDVVIADPTELRYERGRLVVGDLDIDLVYNRLVDFGLEEPRHAAIRQAYLEGAVVLTPNPHQHALYADKRNLVLLSDPAMLASWGVDQEALDVLTGLPRTVSVSPDNAVDLWRNRKDWFFKPAAGHGSKAVYRGHKLTTRVWAEIVGGTYVAQAYAPASERRIWVDGQPERRKLDLRLYVYDGQILLAAARVYQGQTTNFRTPGGGFAALFTV